MKVVREGKHNSAVQFVKEPYEIFVFPFCIHRFSVFAGLSEPVATGSDGCFTTPSNSRAYRYRFAFAAACADHTGSSHPNPLANAHDDFDKNLKAHYSIASCGARAI